MRKLTKQAAIESVARHFSAACEKVDGDSPDAWLTVAGERIAVAVATLKQPGEFPKPHLRFDKVALGLVRRLREALDDAVPDGMTVIVTCTAPIRLAAKTEAALKEHVKTCLARPTARWAGTIHGNETHIRLVKSGPRQAPKLIGFAHNPETDAETLLDAAQALLQCVGAAEKMHVTAQETWLVLVAEDDSVEAWRIVCKQLSLTTDFVKILIVSGGGRVDVLAEGGQGTGT